jgi:hypothetical protein
MKNILDRKTSSVEVNDFVSLQAGNHDVRIGKFAVIDSFDKNTKGEQKDVLPEWSDATDQLFLTFVGEKGAISTRLNLQGYVKMSDLTATEIKAKKAIDKNGYACVKNQDGHLVRIEDPARTETALGIVDQLTSALGIDEGITLGDALEKAVEEKLILNIYVKSEVYEGKTQLRVSSFKHAKENVM